jgi:hypothetical protein
VVWWSWNTIPSFTACVSLLKGSSVIPNPLTACSSWWTAGNRLVRRRLILPARGTWTHGGPHYCASALVHGQVRAPRGGRCAPLWRVPPDATHATPGHHLAVPTQPLKSPTSASVRPCSLFEQVHPNLGSFRNTPFYEASAMMIEGPITHHHTTLDALKNHFAVPSRWRLHVIL